MSGGVISAYEGDPTSPAATLPAGGDTRPVSWWNAVKANWRLNLDDDEAGNYNNLVKGYNDLEDALVAAGHPRARYRNPDWGSYFQPVETSPDRYAALWADVEEARRANPRAFADLPATRKDFETWAFARKGRRAKDMETAAQGGPGSAIVPGLTFGLATMGSPENLAQIPLGGGATSLTGFLAKQFAAGVLGQALQTPQVTRSRANMGESYSDSDLGRDLVMAGVTNSAFAGLMAYGPEAVGKVGGAVLDRVDPLRGDRQLADAFRQSIKGDWAATPQQAAALNILERSADIGESNPYHLTYAALDAHANRIQSVLDRLETLPRPATPDLAPALAPAVRAVSGDFTRAWSAILHIEGGLAPDGSFRTSPAGAIGPAQLMPGTAPEAARLAGLPFDPARLRSDRRYNEALGQALYSDLLRRFDGDPVKAAAAYNAGEGSARKGTGVRGAIAKATAEGNPENWVAHLPAETQGYVRSFRERTGGETTIVMPEGIDPLLIRPEAMDAVRPQLIAGGREIPIASFTPGEIGVDAKLMQFKSGGDAQGVTERLRGVQQWDPMSAGMVTVWEANDGRRLIADGHQRLGLANRIATADPSQDIRLNAFVLREADGFTAADARALTALKNIREGSGSAADAAKVFREVGLDPELLKSLPPRSALIRDGKALASLSDEAFGAVINDVIPESYGAAIGALAPDPATHMALVDLLAKTDPPNRKQAEAIVRQAMDAGFHAETQEELFGTRNMVFSIFAQKARLLDKALGELRKLKGAFGVAARNAEALDQAGNRIDVAASQAEAAANANALGLVDALALRKGNAVSDLFNRAAQRLAEGEPLAAVTRDIVAELRQLDLEAALRDAGGAGGQPGGSGRAGLADHEAAPGEGEPGALTPADRDELEAAGQGGFSFFDAEAHKAFDDPAGKGVEEVAQSVWHDVRAADHGDVPVANDAGEMTTAWEAHLNQAEAKAREIAAAGDQPLFHATSGEWQAANPSGLGMTFWAENVMDAARYAGAGGGRRAVGNTGRVMVQRLPSGAKLLDITTPEGLSVLAGLPQQGRIAGVIIKDAARDLREGGANATNSFWSYTKRVSGGDAVGIKRYIVDALRAEGYAGMRFMDDRHTSVALFDEPPATALDNGAAVDPNLAARDRERALLGAEAPMRAKTEQDGTMGSPLFDAADQPKFDLGDGKGARTIAEIEAELDADQAAIDAIKGCLL